jgi:hypothetical protein
LSDSLIIDYINRFYISDVDARIQLFDYKTRYSFETVPFVDQYNMPYYGIGPYNPNNPLNPFGAPGSQYNPMFPLQTEPGNTIAPYPVYQGFMSPAYVNGIEVPLMTSQSSFFRIWPNYIEPMSPVAEGNNGAIYSFQIPFQPALRGNIDVTGQIAAYNNPLKAGQQDTVNYAVPLSSVFSGVYITTQDANGNPLIVQDSGQVLSTNANLGLLRGNCTSTWNATTNVVNYLTGEVFVTFSSNVPPNVNINAQNYFFEPGMPRSIGYFNNILLLRPPPDNNYLVELTAYLSPASFLNSSQAIPFGYMAEYLARGAARKILSDTGDIEQFQFYEPLFREQETLVWKRSQRQFTADRTDTIFSSLSGQSPFSNFGQGT